LFSDLASKSTELLACLASVLKNLFTSLIMFNSSASNQVDPRSFAYWIKFRRFETTCLMCMFCERPWKSYSIFKELNRIQKYMQGIFHDRQHKKKNMRPFLSNNWTVCASDHI
jgi:hypothetical protein